jgi:hypothetical protein
MTRIRRTLNQIAIFILVPTSTIAALFHDWWNAAAALFGALALAL